MGEEDDFTVEHSPSDPEMGGEATSSNFGDCVDKGMAGGLPRHHAMIAALNELGPVPIAPGPSANY